MPEWLTSEQTSEILNFHVEYVRRLAREGKLEGMWSQWERKSIRRSADYSRSLEIVRMWQR